MVGKRWVIGPIEIYHKNPQNEIGESDAKDRFFHADAADAADGRGRSGPWRLPAWPWAGR